MNIKKAKNSDYFVVRNPFVYSGCVALFVLNIAYFMGLTQAGDKSIINSMINIDENLARKNLTIKDYN